MFLTLKNSYFVKNSREIFIILYTFLQNFTQKYEEYTRPDLKVGSKSDDSKNFMD